MWRKVTRTLPIRYGFHRMAERYCALFLRNRMQRNECRRASGPLARRNPVGRTGLRRNPRHTSGAGRAQSRWSGKGLGEQVVEAPDAGRTRRATAGPSRGAAVSVRGGREPDQSVGIPVTSG
ncbi:hypothetical protein GCM10010339_09220 [Streptomyces alanosinicus]|uniref:Uncharacterized protein n=1 Tax=Streptomyces alanosinicus TaxID=68171 RepID=A0A918YD19_9ACTN|nr:hypothetical protein GCM10010339_09220 [Streptomyces alanosinicus]